MTYRSYTQGRQEAAHTAVPTVPSPRPIQEARPRRHPGTLPPEITQLPDTREQLPVIRVQMAANPVTPQVTHQESLEQTQHPGPRPPRNNLALTLLPVPMVQTVKEVPHRHLVGRLVGRRQDLILRLMLPPQRPPLHIQPKPHINIEPTHPKPHIK